MKCKLCVEAGLKSEVSVSQYGTRTLMAGPGPYYDEDGEYHSHDPNKGSYGASCSQGHTWSEQHFTPCPATDCRWNDTRKNSSGLVKA